MLRTSSIHMCSSQSFGDVLQLPSYPQSLQSHSQPEHPHLQALWSPWIAGLCFEAMFIAQSSLTSTSRSQMARVEEKPMRWMFCALFSSSIIWRQSQSQTHLDVCLSVMFMLWLWHGLTLEPLNCPLTLSPMKRWIHQRYPLTNAWYLWLDQNP